MINSTTGEAAIAVVFQNTKEVQAKGNWELLDRLFADDFVDHARSDSPFGAATTAAPAFHAALDAARPSRSPGSATDCDVRREQSRYQRLA
jgi:hypothetical protein